MSQTLTYKYPIDSFISEQENERKINLSSYGNNTAKISKEQYPFLFRGKLRSPFYIAKALKVSMQDCSIQLKQSDCYSTDECTWMVVEGSIVMLLVSLYASSLSV